MHAPRATPSRRVAMVVVAVALAAAVAGPVAARPYGAVGRDGEVRYAVPAEDIRVRCIDRTDASGNPRKLCVHWTTAGKDAAGGAWVDSTRKAFATAWKTIVNDLGYRAPLRDGGRAAKQGPNTGTDIYLADIADDGTFGYCTWDRHTTGEKRPAYCVVDNDFAEFATGDAARLRELRATAAHEFFHAVQYAYDVTTPRWLSEGTAVWMEDQVFDSANTNRRYLDITALRQPEDALDRSGGSTGYGAWLFWQFLSERQSPARVRSVWTRVAGDTGSEADTFRAVQEATGLTTGEQLARFGAENYGVGASWSYSEGTEYLSALGGTRPPLDASHTLTATRINTDATGAPGQPRTIDAPPRSVNYVRVKSEIATSLSAWTRDAESFALLHHTAASGFGEPVVGGDTTAPVEVAAGDFLILVLANPSSSTRTLEYQVTQ